MPYYIELPYIELPACRAPRNASSAEAPFKVSSIELRVELRLELCLELCLELHMEATKMTRKLSKIYPF